MVGNYLYYYIIVMNKKFKIFEWYGSQIIWHFTIKGLDCDEIVLIEHDSDWQTRLFLKDRNKKMSLVDDNYIKWKEVLVKFYNLEDYFNWNTES